MKVLEIGWCRRKNLWRKIYVWSWESWRLRQVLPSICHTTSRSSSLIWTIGVLSFEDFQVCYHQRHLCGRFVGLEHSIKSLLSKSNFTRMLLFWLVYFYCLAKCWSDVKKLDLPRYMNINEHYSMLMLSSSSVNITFVTGLYAFRQRYQIPV